MNNFEIQKLRELPIESVAARGGLKVSRHLCRCPFHDDHRPSMRFIVAKNRFVCYACGKRGDVFDLALGLLPAGSSFMDACRWLADESNVILTEYKPEPKREAKPFDASRYEKYFEHPWLSPRDCKFLFEKRHLNPAVVRYCRLNTYKEWLQIPYYSQQRKLIGIQRRYMGNDPEQPRFLFPYGKGCHLYNLPVLQMLRPGENLYLAEGCTDCFALLSAGVSSIAIPAATLLDKQEMLREFTEAGVFEKNITLHVFPDKDDAGTYLYGQLLDFANENGLCLVRHDLPEGCKDFSDYWTSKALSVKC